ncbi:MAG: hypothetical protein HUJ26_21075 [Planctomycetaceae bacterium]|nr:hypothetical protein [Planctomycetaceae bacterium]
MNSRLRQLLLLTAVACCWQASIADAGYLSLSDSVELPNLSTASSSMAANFDIADSAPELPVNTLLERLEQIDRLVGLSSSHGGMSAGNSTVTGGSTAPAALLISPILPTPSMVSPLCLREIPYHPRLLIADIFRPPCA